MLIITLLLAYVLGSLCSAIIVCRLAKLPDPRLQGSKNPGATNVLRIGGKRLAALTLALDAFKGSAAVLIAYLLGVEHLLWVAFAATLGHIFPCFYGFAGGKGIATAFGCIIVATPPLALLGLATWLIVVWFSRYSSLAALAAITVVGVANYWYGADPYAIAALIALIVWSHGGNIARLWQGTESRLQF